MIKSTRLEGVHYWSRFQADRGIDFNGFLWVRPEGNLLIDPMELDPSELAAVREKGGARWILVTNHDHLRATGALREALGAEVLAPAPERARFGADAELVDRWFESAAELPSELRGAVELFWIRGGKAPVELALFLRGPRAFFFGDVVRSHVSGELCLLPDAKLSERAAVVESLQELVESVEALGERPAEGVLLGDGDSLFRDGRAVLRELLDRLA